MPIALAQKIERERAIYVIQNLCSASELPAPEDVDDPVVVVQFNSGIRSELVESPSPHERASDRLTFGLRAVVDPEASSEVDDVVELVAAIGIASSVVDPVVVDAGVTLGP